MSNISLNYHLQSLIELAYKTDKSSADYHLSRLQAEVIHHNLNLRGIQELAMHQRLEAEMWDEGP